MKNRVPVFRVRLRLSILCVRFIRGQPIGVKLLLYLQPLFGGPGDVSKSKMVNDWPANSANPKVSRSDRRGGQGGGRTHILLAVGDVRPLTFRHSEDGVLFLSERSLSDRRSLSGGRGVGAGV